MSTAKAISSKKSKPNKLAVDLKKLKPSESQKLLELAIQKYPTFANEVSKAIKTAKSREKQESIQKFYDDLLARLYGILEGPYYDSDDHEMVKMKRWGMLDETDQGALCDVYQQIRKSVNSATANEKYEIAFKALLVCWNSVSTAQEEKTEEEKWEDDLSQSIDEAKNVVKEMALEWMRKDGEINEDIYKWVLTLLNEEVTQVEGFEELLEELEDEYLAENE